MKVLTIEQQKSYENAKFYYICKEKFEDKHAKDEKHHRVRDHCYYTWEYRSVEHSICNLKYSVPEEIPIVFCDGSKYDYHFIMKELAEEFEENTGKNITFSVLIEKEVIRIDKKGKDIIKTESYRLQFIDYGKLVIKSAFVNNLAKGIDKIKFKYRRNDKKCETWSIVCKDWDCFLKYTNVYVVTRIIRKSLIKT